MTDYQGVRVGVVGVAGGWSSELLADRLAERTGFRLLIDSSRLVTDLSRGRVTYQGESLGQLDGVVIKKIGASYGPDLLDRLEVYKYLAEGGLRIFSRPTSIMGLLNRISCTLSMARAGIPMPKTVITEDPEAGAQAIGELGEVVFKPLYSTKARGMEVLRRGDSDLLDRLIALRQGGNSVLYLQQKVNLPGRDLSLVFIGGKYVGTYARVKAEGAWNTTTKSGGHYEAHEPSEELINLAHRAQSLFDMDLTSVDIAETEDGPVVFEVSAFGGYRGLHESAGIDAGALLAEHVLRRLKHEG